MAEVKSLYYDGKFLRYILSVKNIKKMYLKIDDDGEIKVSAPMFINLKDIEKFLYSNMDFIQRSIDKNKDSLIFNLDSKIISILGAVFKVKEVPSLKNSVKINDGEIFLFYKKNEDIKKLIKKTLKSHANNYLRKRLFEISNEIGIPYSNLKIKWLKTKWGHCDSNKNIVLNTKLICHKKDVIDYVLIHELCHIIYMNHGKDYWNLVSQYCPNWKKLRLLLKK